MTQKFYNIVKESSGDTVIDIFGNIDSWFGYDDYAFREALNNAEGENVTVRINSGGGDVFIGHNIYNMVKQSNKNIKVVVNGLAASIASVIAMAGDVIEMPSNAMMMIHNPSTIQQGTAEEMRKSAETLDKVAETIKNVYVSRTGLTKDEITEMMNNETWLTAEEAKAQGFCDVVTGEIDGIENKVDAQFLNHFGGCRINNANESNLEKRISDLEKRVAKLEEDNKSKKQKEDEPNKEQVKDPNKQDEPSAQNGWSSFFLNHK